MVNFKRKIFIIGDCSCVVSLTDYSPNKLNHFLLLNDTGMAENMTYLNDEVNLIILEKINGKVVKYGEVTDSHMKLINIMLLFMYNHKIYEGTMKLFTNHIGSYLISDIGKN